MNKAEILAALRAEHAAMQQAIQGLTPAQMTEPGVTPDGRSVKDILAHVAAWEAEMVTALYHSRIGRNPSITKALADIHGWNAQRRAENADRPLDRVLADWRGVREALMHRMADWDDAELNSEVTWRTGRTMAELIAANSYGHEAEHRAEVEAWRHKVMG